MRPSFLLCTVLACFSGLPLSALDYNHTTAPASSTPDIVVNEIAYAWSQDAIEFIELFNNTAFDVNLADVEFSDARRQLVRITEQPIAVPSGGFAVFTRDLASFVQYFPGIPAFQPDQWPALNNTGDTVFLFYNGILCDSVTYDPVWGGNGVSLERIHPAGPSNARVNWKSSIDPRGGTPGFQNSVYFLDNLPPRITFSEQISGHEIEIYFDEPVDFSSLHPACVEISGQQCAQVRPTDDSSFVASFTGNIPPGSLTVRGIRDLFGNELTQLTTDVARLAEPGDLVVNEIMYAPRADNLDGLPDQPEYVEIFSRVSFPVTLHRCFWTGRMDEEGKRDTLHFGTPRVFIPPFGFAVIFSQPDPVSDLYAASDLALAFPAADLRALHITLIPVKQQSLGLRNSGDTIRLHAQDDRIIDEIFFVPEWHNPVLAETRGISLERIDPDGPSNDRLNWSSCPDPSGGTPGYQNALFHDPDQTEAAQHLQIEPEVFSPDFDGYHDDVHILYELEENVSMTHVRIFDSHGRLVRTLHSPFLGGRSGQVTWNGLDDNGCELRIGIYIVHLEAFNVQTGSTVSYVRPVVLARSLK